MNAATCLLQAATRNPDRAALRYGDQVVTYERFAQRAARLAGWFREAGLRSGDRVGIVQRNCPELLESIYAALMAGLVVVPVNMRLHPREIAYIGRDSGWRALVHTEEFNEPLAGIAHEMPELHARISTVPSTGEHAYVDLTSAGDLSGPVDVSPESVCWLFYTSGTTGHPKGVMWTHRTLHNLVLGYLADVYPLQDDDVVLHAAPLSHGSGTVALPAVARGAENVILHTRSFTPETVFRLIEQHAVTNIAFLAPTQIVKLLDEFVPGAFDLSSLRCLQYGGAPMYVEQLRQAISTFGAVLVQVFGQGECPMTITSLSRRDHARWSPTGHERLGSAGVARSGVEVRIVDEHDRLLPPGTSGEILVRGEIVMPGYWRNEEATAEALRGGWLHTGDIGRLDDAGYLYVLDRSKEMIVSGGNNIYPREVEEVLLTHSAIRECAVIGVPDDYWGESVHAVVSLVEGGSVSSHELIAHCAANLAGYKKPRTIEVQPDLPKNAYGKILKRELREPYWRGYERRVGGGAVIDIADASPSSQVSASGRS